MYIPLLFNYPFLVSLLSELPLLYLFQGKGRRYFAIMISSQSMERDYQAMIHGTQRRSFP